jgi:hypothetical protein
MSSVQDCIAVMQHLRNDDDDDTFIGIFETASAVNGEDITVPRLPARQRNQTNVPADYPLQHYRRAVFLPLIDCCLAHMKERFSKQALIASQLTALIAI